jgi:hypothetical protein
MEGGDGRPRHQRRGYCRSVGGPCRGASSPRSWRSRGSGSGFAISRLRVGELSEHLEPRREVQFLGDRALVVHSSGQINRFLPDSRFPAVACVVVVFVSPPALWRIKASASSGKATVSACRIK